jgi:hypothetical protein
VCWPWSHKWSKWEVTTSGQMLARADVLGLPLHDVIDKPQVIGYYELQRRICENCGKSQLREEVTR